MKNKYLILCDNHKMKKQLSIFKLLPIIITAVLPTNALAIKAQTSRTIQGQAPYIWDIQKNNIILTSDDLLVISVPNNSGSSTILPSSANKSIDFPVGKTFNDITTKAIIADNVDRSFSSLATYYKLYDYDGDTSGTVDGSIKAVWKNNGEVITTLNSKPTTCGGPYSLTVSITNTSAKTQYGDPKLRDYGTQSVTYTFKQADMGICYLQPLNLDVHPAKNGLGGGYDSTSYDPNHGFLPKNKEFPGTAFKGAGFYILGAGGDQSKYKCSISNGANNTVKLSTVSGKSGQNCYVEYTSTRPSSEITIDLYYEKEPNVYQKIDSYTFKKPSKWITVQEPKLYFAKSSVNSNAQSVYPAANVCAGNAATATMTYSQSLTYFYSMQDISNIPLKSDGSLTISEDVRFTRTLDKTFMGVWGDLYNGYPNSDFYHKTTLDGDGNTYNTNTLIVGPSRNVNPIGEQYVIGLDVGLTGWQQRSNLFACKETIY